MAQLYKQGDRQLVLSTPLGADVLLLTSFSGAEEMSRLFHYRLEMWSEKVDVTARTSSAKV